MAHVRSSLRLILEVVARAAVAVAIVEGSLVSDVSGGSESRSLEDNERSVQSTTSCLDHTTLG